MNMREWAENTGKEGKIGEGRKALYTKDLKKKKKSFPFLYLLYVFMWVIE